MITIVTGGNGFLGQHLAPLLDNPYVIPSQAYDLRREAHVEALFKHTGKVDTLYHLAAVVGGIGANRLHPGVFFYDNMRMGLNVIHAAMVHGVRKVVFVGTTCSYPKLTPIPFREHSLFDGYPEETNAPYGIAKRALYVMLKAYQDEYGLRFAYLVPTNLYGPGDNFDDASSHVIPALIKKCIVARDTGVKEIEVWGSGRATRDFLYVGDAARAIALAGANYDNPIPLNLGSGHEINIGALVHLIQQVTGYKGAVRYNTSKPDGQPRRCLDSSAAKHSLGWRPEIELKEGLKRTVGWYESSRNDLR